MVGVQQWAEIRRLVLVEGRSQREVAARLGLARDTVAKAVHSETPPRYLRVPAGSKLDPFKDWVCEQLRGDPTIQSQRLREMAGELGYVGGKTIFDEFVREVRPRYQVRRTFQRTIYRPGELVQCDLWEPREPIAVGHGQTRRGWVVTAELCWSRVVAGALIFSKEAPVILWGVSRCLDRIGALPEKLVWDREGAIAPAGRPTDEFAAFCGQLGVGWIIWTLATRRRRARSSGHTGSCARTFSPAAGSPTRSISSCSSTAGVTASTGACTERLARSRPNASSRSGSGCRRCPPSSSTAASRRDDAPYWELATATANESTENMMQSSRMESCHRLTNVIDKCHRPVPQVGDNAGTTTFASGASASSVSASSRSGDSSSSNSTVACTRSIDRAQATIELIEGPAPTEDSSVPPDPAE
ncbi:MAG: hypothetical protein ACXVHQ_39795 [Solirubrobacteraceae bacterium]